MGVETNVPLRQMHEKYRVFHQEHAEDGRWLMADG